ncbi:MAG: DUF3891 family protein [Terriglobales bacterium]
MVLRPINGCRLQASGSRQNHFVPAWPPVERAQRHLADKYWLVTQPDHASLAGALAANFTSPDFPKIDEQIARAIEVHDAGWAIFESEAQMNVAPPLDARGKPLSFIEIVPQDFLRAWTASIDRAEQVGAAGGFIVSRHFCALGQGRLASAMDGAEDSSRLLGFLKAEDERQSRLQARVQQSCEELEHLVRALQFCDLLSLFLCCGAADAVEFPQEFAAGKVRVRCEADAYILDPSPFQTGTQRPVSLGVEARGFPCAGKTAKVATLPFLLW